VGVTFLMRKGIFFEVGANAGLEMLAHPFALAFVVQLLLGTLAKAVESGPGRVKADDSRKAAVDETRQRGRLGLSQHLRGSAYKPIFRAVEPPVGRAAIECEEGDLSWIRHLLLLSQTRTVADGFFDVFSDVPRPKMSIFCNHYIAEMHPVKRG
jgi:hypothetical protein